METVSKLIKAQLSAQCYWLTSHLSILSFGNLLNCSLKFSVLFCFMNFEKCVWYTYIYHIAFFNALFWSLCCSHLIFWYFPLKILSRVHCFILLIYQSVREVFCAPPKLVHTIKVYWFVLQKPTLYLCVFYLIRKLSGLSWFVYFTVIWFNKVIKNYVCLKEFFFIGIAFVWRYFVFLQYFIKRIE